MGIRRYRLRSFAWLASFAVLLSVLAPTLSHGLRAARISLAVADICTTGPSLALANAADEPDGQAGGFPAQLDLQDCAYCLNHAGAIALPPESNTPAPVIDASGRHSVLPGRQTPSKGAWTVAQPRAPPSA